MAELQPLEKFFDERNTRIAKALLSVLSRQNKTADVFAAIVQSRSHTPFLERFLSAGDYTNVIQQLHKQGYVGFHNNGPTLLSAKFRMPKSARNFLNEHYMVAE
jgi:hypothetical protein